jgi:lactate racemase
MKKIELPYGDRIQTAELPDDIEIQYVEPFSAKAEEPLEVLLERAMENPYGSLKLEEMAKADDTVVIVVNDQTRPGPNDIIIAAIMKRLEKAGIKDEQVTVLFATGSHRDPTEEERKKIMGEEYYRRLRNVSHNCRDDEAMVYVGETASGLPVYVNRLVTECSLLITTGLIAPHHVAGFSGGRKSIVPGVAGLKTLHIHHSFPIYQYEPAMGYIYGNPFHEAAVEAAKIAKVRFIVNAVQDPHKNFFEFVAGDLEEAHAAGVELCKKVTEVRIPKYGDVIIASPGGFPRDIDLYQSQKALSVAEVIGAPNCTYIAVAECRDGFGEENFHRYMVETESVQRIIDRFAEEGFQIGNNKAFNFARALKKGRVIIVTDKIAKGDLEEAKLEGASTLQEAVDMSLAGKKAKVVTVIKTAANIVPIVEESCPVAEQTKNERK